jgi:hypothetical protein
MRRWTLPSLAVALAALVLAPSAPAAYGVSAFDGAAVASAQGGLFTQAGGHPHAITATIEWNKVPDPDFVGADKPEGNQKDVIVDLPLGLVGNPAPLQRCTARQLSGVDDNQGAPTCPNDSQVGTVGVRTGLGQITGVNPIPASLYNMVPSAGAPASFGFNIAKVPFVLDAKLRGDGSYGLSVGIENAPQALRIWAIEFALWGDPGDPSHDSRRCNNPNQKTRLCDSTTVEHTKPHSSNLDVAFLTLPTACPGTGELWQLRTDSWEDPGNFVFASYRSHEPPGFPEPPEAWGPERGLDDCDAVPFDPRMTVQPTVHDAESPTGLSVSIDVPTDGILNPDGTAQSQIREISVSLPEGVSVNPSQGEGLGVCTPAQFANESLDSPPGGGCPSNSKVGSVQVVTPVLDEPLAGFVHIAQPDDLSTGAAGAENPFDSLLALYIVIKDPERGLLVKLAGEVESDPQTGRLSTTFDDLPKLPFSGFTFRFREGQRSPLATPRTCGIYVTEAGFTPWSDPRRTVTRSSAFEITSGPGGGPCPQPGAGPFAPGMLAGTLNNNAGSHSAFSLRLTRKDGEQEITSFSADLPPGLAAKLVGVERCSDAAIAAAAGKSGREEATSPSCPAESLVGHSLVGAGVGSLLTYAPGSLYLAGPYNGSPLSIAAITSATVGPFDLGTVVLRSAFRIDRDDAQVHVDAAGSDPIPHILEGIPLHVRDIRVNVDRSDFTLNPTSCRRKQVAGRLTGTGLSFADPLDDVPFEVFNPFQVANCSRLGFRPGLGARLVGGTTRSANAGIVARLRGRSGDANLRRVVVTLPRAFQVDHRHLGNICSEAELAARECAGRDAIGAVWARTPLLDEPLRGKVYAVSGSGGLPRLAIVLRGEITAVIRGDTVARDAQLRAVFDSIPDAPVSAFRMRIYNGKLGYLVLNRDVCRRHEFLVARYVGQNSRTRVQRVRLRAGCGASGGLAAPTVRSR